jgi:hypothetical protein
MVHYWLDSLLKTWAQRVPVEKTSEMRLNATNDGFFIIRTLCKAIQALTLS